MGAILSSAKLHLLGIKQAGLDEKDKKLHEKGAGLLNDVIKKVRGISHSPVSYTHLVKDVSKTPVRTPDGQVVIR